MAEETSEFWLKIRGYLIQTCEECGWAFRVAYYEGETEEDAKRLYCLRCLIGYDPDKATTKGRRQ